MFKMCVLRVIFIFIIVIIIGSVFGGDNDYYTSMSGLQRLAKVEQDIVHLLKDYVKEMEDRIDKANNFLEDYRESVLGGHMKKDGDSEPTYELTRQQPGNDKELEELASEISAHPLKSFRMVRRLARELPEFEKLVRGDGEKKLLKKVESSRKGIVLPQIDDVRGAIEALLRIQDAYDLHIDDFSQGEFMNLKTGSGLRAIDLYQIGVYAFKSTIYTRAIEWLERAFIMVTEEGDTSVSRDEIQLKLDEVIDSHNEVLKGASISEHFVKNKYLYKSPVKKNLTERLERVKVISLQEHVLYLNENNWGDLTNFAALCRGKMLQPQSYLKNLKCWYGSKHPYTTIAPVKTEELHRNPQVLQFYDVISNKQIDRLYELAKPSLARAKVQGKDDLESKEVSYQRTSTTAWIREETEPILKNLPLTLEAISGLALRPVTLASELLQISSYGIGGHYNPHFDNLYKEQFLSKISNDERLRGDRIATLMLYLSDVERGGGTAFPRLGVAAKAVKGSAIFWFNQKSDGEPDPWAIHGGCPIVYGNKWVANKWIRANSQMFKRTCAIHPEKRS